MHSPQRMHRAQKLVLLRAGRFRIRVLVTCQPRGTSRNSATPPAPTASEPTPGVVMGRTVATRRPGCHRKTYVVLWAGHDTIQADGAFCRVAGETPRRIDRAGGTGSGTALATGTGGAHTSGAPTPLSTPAQQTPKRAQVAAPETLGDTIEGNHGDQGGLSLIGWASRTAGLWAATARGCVSNHSTGACTNGTE